MSTRRVVVHPDTEVLIEAVAARVLTRLIDLQSVRRPIHWVLTGGSVGIASLAAINRSPLRRAVDFEGVHVWWGDERYLPSGDAERNETQAREALLDDLVAAGALPEGNIHPVAPADQVGTAEEAASRYAQELAQFAAPDTPMAVPAFDLLMLGVGPDAHVASLFPGHPALAVTDTAAVAVHDSPKPPPTRVSLTRPAITAARAVWLAAGGADKADAVAAALADGTTIDAAPAVAARGSEETLWLIDAAAAAGR